VNGRIQRQWSLRNPDDGIVREIARRTGLSPTSSRILVNRGLTEPEAAERFLSDGLPELNVPVRMLGIDKAARRLADAVAAREPLLVYADYDVDGATGAAVLYLFLKDVSPDLPIRIHQNHRIIDGYGLKTDHLVAAAAEGCRLVVTVDCGISDVAAIREASAAGIDVIVTDHHLPGPELPAAYAVVNPRQDGCEHPSKDLAGVGVVFMLVCGIRRVLREMGHFDTRPEPNLARYLDLVALGTVADMVPLRGDNRILVRSGLAELRANTRPGLAALMQLSNIQPDSVNETDLGFRVAPRLNAAGRLGDSNRSAALLVTSDPEEATRLAQELQAENGRRQKEEEKILKGVEARLADDPGFPGSDGAIVLADEHWHLGVLGIVASKIVDRYSRPVVLLSIDGLEATGSCRTIEGFPIVEALDGLAPLLTRYGGHSQAAGIALPVANLAAFREGLSSAARASASAQAGRVPSIEFDGVVRLADVTFGLIDEWERLRPFGMGNREPVLRADGVRVNRIRPFGPEGRHISFEIEGDGCRFEVSAFNRPDSGVKPGAVLDMLFTPQLSVYRGSRSVRLLLRDLRLTA
jgi:single-stranded-DNA-specific exonuclease